MLSLGQESFDSINVRPRAEACVLTEERLFGLISGRNEYIKSVLITNPK